MIPRLSPTDLRRGEALLAPERPPKRKLQILDWRPFAKGPLRGFVTVELPVGLRIIDCPVLRAADGRFWVGLPAKPAFAPGGAPKFDATTGKPVYTAMLKWRDRAIADRFSKAVIALIEEQYPGSLAAGDPS
jgi:hypothetical protein